MSTSIRLRLAVWYAALLALIVAGTSFLSYSFHSTYHYEEADRALVAAAVHVLSELRATGSPPRIEEGSMLPSIDQFAPPDVYVRLYDAEGQLLASSPNAGQQPAADPRTVLAAPPEAESGGSMTWLMRPLTALGRPLHAATGSFATYREAGHSGRTRLYALPINDGGSTWGYLETGDSLERLDESMAQLRLLLAVMSVVGLLAALLGGWAIAGGALRPVAAMASTARAIALSRGFSRRLPDLGRRDELGQLAATFNEMLASLDEAYRAQQRFVADASHELRTPLTTIQGSLELLDRSPGLDDQERSETLAALRQEVGRMSRLVADLLALARADAGQILKVQRVELDRLVLEVFREGRVIARGQKLAVREMDQVQVEGDADRLKQLLLILVDNALKYTPEGGEVQLGLRTEAGIAVITVADTGIGIDQEDLPHIFDRFYRADKARGRDRGGTGLGLTIARWITERHGGLITVESTPGKGSVFVVRLPLGQLPPKL